MDRQTDYEPRPEIARMKSFNDSDGFYSYHVKWAIGKLPIRSDDDNTIGSKLIKTKNSRNDGENVWDLRFFDGAINLKKSFDEDDDQEIPIIARVKLINETKGISEFTSSVLFLLANFEVYSYFWDIPDEVAKGLSNTDDYVVHCWMDLPKKYNGCSHSPRGCPNSGSALLSSSLARSFEKVMRKNGDPTSDIELVIKDSAVEDPRFYCHRHILTARSPVFETMFTHGQQFKEANDRIVEIEDVDADTLKLVLEYMYTGQIMKRLQDDMEKKVINSLLNAAEKYMLPELKDECVLALIGFGYTACDDEKWIEYLQLAETFNLEYLRKVCMLALSTNMRSLGEENIRRLVSPRSMKDLLSLVTTRGDMTKTIEVETEV